MIRLILIVLLACGLFPGCNVSEGGTEIPNELVGHEFSKPSAGSGTNAAADVAPGAEVRLVPVGYIPGGSQGPDSSGSVLFTANTDGNGRFSFKDVPPGQYNLIAAQGELRSFRDSLSVTGKGQELKPDTLKAPASLTGKVELEPQDEIQSVTVQVLGTTLFVNVDADGSFHLAHLGAGQYRLRVVTVLPQYAPLYREVTVRAGMDDTLRDPLKPFFTGTPVVRGLTVTQGTEGSLVLHWSKPAFVKVQSYLIYRDSVGVLLPSTVPLRRVTDTVFIDTIYSIEPRAGQVAYHDVVPRTFSYRVKILDQSGNIGPSFGFVEATTLPPTKVPVTGTWRRAANTLPISPSKANLFSLRDSLWVLRAGYDSTLGGGQNRMEVRVSADGFSWAAKTQAVSPAISVTHAIVYRDSIWVLGSSHDSLPNRIDTMLTVYSIWNSADGANWREVIHNVPWTERYSPGFFAFKDRLWLVSGESYRFNSGLATWSSTDGKNWTSQEVDYDPHALDGAVLGFRDRIISAGGGNRIFGISNYAIHYSVDGARWDSSAAPKGMLPRQGNTLTEHAGRLWFIGGALDPGQYPATYFNDIWSSTDGLVWILENGQAPFAARSGHSAISFNGKLWVMGGMTANGFATDLWYMDTP